MNIRRKPVIFTCLSMCAACATLIDGAAAQTTGLAGKFVMPGIINLHGLVGNTVDLAQDPMNFTGENAERELRIYASSGVTSVGSMGSEQPLIMDIRARQRAADRPTITRIFTARRGFTGLGGYPTTAPGRQVVPYEVSIIENVVRDKPVDGARIEMMKKRGAWQAAATLTRAGSTFVFDSPSPMLDGPFFAPSASAAVRRTLKDREFQKKAAAEPDDMHWIRAEVRIRYRYRSSAPHTRLFRAVGDGTDG